MAMIGPINSGAAVGGDGVATATGTSTTPIHGFIYSVYIKYNDAPPAGTTDVTVKTKGTSPAQPSINVLVVTNAATDGIFIPRLDSCKNDATLLTDYNQMAPVNDYVQVVIAQANAADNVDVWLMVLPE